MQLDAIRDEHSANNWCSVAIPNCRSLHFQNAQPTPGVFARFMRLHHFIAFALAVDSVSAAFNTSLKAGLNGWYPCSEYTFSDEGSSTGLDAECAVYRAPLCYPGICETLEAVNPNVDIFFKRFPATTANPETAPNVWLLQGGPGDSSAMLEIDMVTLHKQLDGAVNVYMMDHRGTGRSTRLDCVAAQVTTTGSPRGKEIDSSEVPACARDLHKKYGNLASFSVTTAATDLATFISKYTNDASTIVYGVSYGTMLLERLMHLAPPKVVGYALDSITSVSGAPPDEFLCSSEWDINFGEAADAFLALCDEDDECKSRFAGERLNETLQGLIQQFDKNPNTTCAEVVSSTGWPGDYTPSYTLRAALGAALGNPYFRTLIPPVVYRLKRCASIDEDVLTEFFTAMFEVLGTKSQDTAFESKLLYNLIIFSEMWESPSPSMSKLKGLLDSAKMSFSGEGGYSKGPQYCAFSKEKSPACDELKSNTYDGDGIIYKHDQYWNKTATIPSQASVLLLSGRLDAQTPHKYAKSLLNVLDGDNKELITFDYAPHAILIWTQMAGDGDAWGATCGMEVLASYVRNGGNLERLDKSCVDEMPAFNLKTPAGYLNSYMGTDDAYDGAFNSSLRSFS